MVAMLGNPVPLLVNMVVLLGMVTLNVYILGLSLQEKKYYVLLGVSIFCCLVGFYYLQMYFVEIGWISIKDGMVNMSGGDFFC